MRRGSLRVRGTQLLRRLVEQPLEPEGVELLRLDPKHVPRSLRLENRARRTRIPPRLEQLAELRDVVTHLADRGRRRAVAVEILGDPLDGDDPVGVQEQDRQHGPLPRAAEPQRPRLADNLEWAEDFEVQAHLNER
jgi:hypothetical protein